MVLCALRGEGVGCTTYQSPWYGIVFGEHKEKTPVREQTVFRLEPNT